MGTMYLSGTPATRTTGVPKPVKPVPCSLIVFIKVFSIILPLLPNAGIDFGWLVASERS